jgi:hypothetical protein
VKKGRGRRFREGKGREGKARDNVQQSEFLTRECEEREEGEEQAQEGGGGVEEGEEGRGEEEHFCGTFVAYVCVCVVWKMERVWQLELVCLVSGLMVSEDEYGFKVRLD